MFRGVVFLCLLLAQGMLAGCQNGMTHRISEQEIQQNVNAKLPYSKTYFKIFMPTLEHAKVSLVDKQVLMSFDFKLIAKGLGLFSKAMTPKGSIDVIATPSYKQETGELFLENSKLLNMKMMGVRHSKRLKVSVEKLIKSYLQKHPVYTLNSSDLKKSLAKSFLQTVEVEGNDLVLRFNL